MSLHTSRHPARPTLNHLQPHQHEEVWFVYVRDESSPGLALVTNALSTVDKRGGNNMLNHTHGGAPTPNLAEKNMN